MVPHGYVRVNQVQWGSQQGAITWHNLISLWQSIKMTVADCCYRCCCCLLLLLFVVAAVVGCCCCWFVSRTHWKPKKNVLKFARKHWTVVKVSSSTIQTPQVKCQSWLLLFLSKEKKSWYFDIVWNLNYCCIHCYLCSWRAKAVHSHCEVIG